MSPHMFSWRNEKNIYLIPTLIWSYAMQTSLNIVYTYFKFIFIQDNIIYSGLSFSQTLIIQNYCLIKDNIGLVCYTVDTHYLEVQGTL